MPNYEHMHPFGCLVYVTTPKEKRIKSLTQHRAWKGIFLGYTNTESQYRVWDLQRKVITIARDTRFIESVMPARDNFDIYFPAWTKPTDINVLMNPVLRSESDEAASADLDKELNGQLEKIVIDQPERSSIPRRKRIVDSTHRISTPEPLSQPESTSPKARWILDKVII